MSPGLISVAVFLLVPVICFLAAVLQLTALHSTSWDFRGPMGFRHIIALFFISWIFVCSAATGTIRLVALEVKDTSSRRQMQTTLLMAGNFCEACFKLGVNCVALYLTQRPSFVGALTISRPVFTATKIHLFASLLLFILVGDTVLAIVFSALKVSGRTGHIPAALQSVFSVLSICLLVPLQRARGLRGTSHLNQMWSALLVAQIAGIIPAALVFVDRASTEIVISAFTVVWAACSMAALHVYTSLPLLITFSSPNNPPVKSFPRKTRFSFSRHGSVPMTPTEQFLSLHDPFATPPASFVLSFDPPSSDSSHASHSDKKSDPLLQPHARTHSLPLQVRQAANKDRKRSHSVRGAGSPALPEFPRDYQQETGDAHLSPPVLKIVIDQPTELNVDSERNRALSQLVSTRKPNTDGAIPSIWRSSYPEAVKGQKQGDFFSSNIDV